MSKKKYVKKSRVNPQIAEIKKTIRKKLANGIENISCNLYMSLSVTVKFFYFRYFFLFFIRIVYSYICFLFLRSLTGRFVCDDLDGVSSSFFFSSFQSKFGEDVLNVINIC